jgi:hypothetical protein
MCMNCGCGLPEDDMGSPETITLKSLEEAARAMGQTKEEAMEETYKMLKKLLNKPPDTPATNPAD